MSFDLTGYLARIGLPAPPAADLAGLEALLRAHRLAIPFENLAIPLGQGIAIDSASVFAKLVTARRGGYCFEQNRLFRDALLALGFQVRPLLARVWMGGDGAVPARTHAINLVTIDGAEWIADAGFGGSYTPPLPLTDGAQATAPDGVHHRLTRDETHGWMLWRDGGEGWQSQYSFATDPVWDVDLAQCNHWTATAPGTRFTTLKVVSLALPTGFASLTDRQYRRRAGADATEQVIDDPRVYRLRLSLVFGIDLTADQVAILWESL